MHVWTHAHALPDMLQDTRTSRQEGRLLLLAAYVFGGIHVHASAALLNSADGILETLSILPAHGRTMFVLPHNKQRARMPGWAMESEHASQELCEMRRIKAPLVVSDPGAGSL